jgi:hypothetical protein
MTSYLDALWMLNEQHVAQLRREAELDYLAARARQDRASEKREVSARWLMVRLSWPWQARLVRGNVAL